MVAADVQDAAPKSLTLEPVAAGCGTLFAGSGGAPTATPGELRVQAGVALDRLGVCTFELPTLLRDKLLVSATLTVHQTSMSQPFIDGAGRIIAEGVTFPVPMPQDAIRDLETRTRNGYPTALKRALARWMFCRRWWRIWRPDGAVASTSSGLASLGYKVRWTSTA